MIVMKFGGTSVESAAAMERLAGIVRSRIAQRPIVVVSAMGKTTNRLLEAAQLAVNGQRNEALEKVETLRAYHHAEADRFGASELIEEHFQELTELVRGLAILGELTPRSIDAISSFGERLSSRIVALVLGAKHIDSRTVVVTDERHTQAAPFYAETNERLQKIEWGEISVMGGFIGATLNGVTSTLGRGGSDFTASIVGAGVGAEEIQIWTDVDGMLTCDPTVLPGGRRVKSISFAEAAELAYFGAKVLHPSTVVPAIEKNIPVLILNSRRPEVAGTRITAEGPKSKAVAKSIACKKSITLVNIQSTRMLMAHGFLKRIFEIFDRYETSVDMIATSEVSVSLTIDNASRLDTIRRELEEFAEVESEQDKAIVCLVGDNIRWQSGVAHRVFRALENVNVRMISQGASLRNLSVVVAQSDLREAVECLHREFFTDVDPEVFG
ncbi:lysine-sensitive aspartokinase 3 [Bryobacter aggregatus]|uniref:lysine-sensitive aspartokinase 3 n=1 Tax=Bryobacter aggregatus TaxID=360054 RepID=UPI0004E245C7|nr:lysine-sensitive aspartokinase 3 [Bryobacter aggregatus]